MPKFCGGCGTAVSEEDKHCPKCGYNLSASVGGVTPAAEERPASATPTKSSSAKMVLLTFLVLALSGLVTFLVISRGRGDGGKGPPALLETASQTITATQGGTVTLPRGSSVSIPAGTFTTDQTATLSLMSSLPKQPPSGIITGIGPALVLSFAPHPAVPKTIAYKPIQSIGQEATLTSRDVQFVLNLGSGGSPTGIVGSAPIADIVDLTGGDNFIGIPGTFDSTRNTATFTVPLLRTQEVQSVRVSLANLKPRVESEPLPTPGAKIWTGSQWAEGTSGFDPSKKTLVLVHGMLSSVENAFGDKNCVNLIMRKGGYEQVVGFNYDWTQGIEKSGQELADFLRSLRATGLTQVDIEAHSEGVPVSLAASARTDIPIGKMVLLGGPIMGTPAASVGVVAQAGILGAYSALETVFLNWPTTGALPIPGGRGDITLQDLLTGPFANDLRPDSEVLKNIRKDVRDKMTQEGSSLSKTKLIAIAGTDFEGSPDMLKLGTLLKTFGLFPNEPFDGIVGKSSALGVGSGFTRLTTASYPLSHTQLECDPSVIDSVSSKLSGSGELTLTLKQSQVTCKVGTDYSVELVDRVTGGSPPYSIATDPAGGALPAGMSMGQNGILTGKPEAEGVYDFGVCAVDAGGATSCKGASVTVVAQAKPTISLSTQTLGFMVTEGSNPSSQSFKVTNSGPPGSSLDYKVTAHQRLVVSPISGTLISGGSNTHSVSINTAGLSAGSYVAPITVSDPSATNNPQRVMVNLRINPRSTPPPETSSPTPSPSPSTTFTGIWSGTVKYNFVGVCEVTTRLTLDMKQVGDSITGTFSETVTGTTGECMGLVEPSSSGSIQQGTATGNFLHIAMTGVSGYLPIVGTFTPPTISGTVGGTIVSISYSLVKQR